MVLAFVLGRPRRARSGDGAAGRGRWPVCWARSARSTCRPGRRSWSRWSARDDLPARDRAQRVDLQRGARRRPGGRRRTGGDGGRGAVLPAERRRATSRCCGRWQACGSRVAGARWRGRAGAACAPGCAYVRAQPEQAALLAGARVRLGARPAGERADAVARRSAPSAAVRPGTVCCSRRTASGAVISALRLASRRYTRDEHRRTLLLGLATFGAGLLGRRARAQLSGRGRRASCVAGLGMVRFTATTNTLIQLLVDDDYRGRVMGLHTVMFMGMAPVGSLLLGALGRAPRRPGGARGLGSRAAGDPCLPGGAAALNDGAVTCRNVRRRGRRTRGCAAPHAGGGPCGRRSPARSRTRSR